MSRRPRFDADDEPLSGKPLRTVHEADPRAVAPDLRIQDLDMLTGCGRRVALGSGDARAPVDRPGSALAGSYPSRRGDRLYHPDGRVTDLAGQPIDAVAVQRCTLLRSDAGRGYWERVRGRDA